ncbi:hypothetical protein PSPO01_03133 [Paraphaeosphaeria sporulosa]
MTSLTDFHVRKNVGVVTVTTGTGLWNTAILQSSTTTTAQLAAESLEMPDSLYIAEGLAWWGIELKTWQRLIDKFLESGKVLKRAMEETLDSFLTQYIRTSSSRMTTKTRIGWRRWKPSGSPTICAPES